MKDERMFGNTRVIWNDLLTQDWTEEQIQQHRKESGKRIPQISYEAKLHQMRKSEAV